MILLSDRYQERPPMLSPGSEKYNEMVQKLLEEKKSHTMNTQLKDEAKKALMALSYEKCAFCESIITASARFEVEHFRPRNGITGVKESNGYYWLTYEWTNLLLSCPICNSKKRTQFPLQKDGKRAQTPLKDGFLEYKECCYSTSESLAAEKSLLLHPGFDIPDEHFAFLRNGKIHGLTECGKKTIDVCNLNRKRLVKAREGIVNDVFSDVARLLASIKEYGYNQYRKEFEKIFSKVLRLQEPNYPYSRFAWFIFNNFEYFIIDRLKNLSDRRLVKKTYEYNFNKYKELNTSSS